MSKGTETLGSEERHDRLEWEFFTIRSAVDALRSCGSSRIKTPAERISFLQTLNEIEEKVRQLEVLATNGGAYLKPC